MLGSFQNTGPAWVSQTLLFGCFKTILGAPGWKAQLQMHARSLHICFMNNFNMLHLQMCKKTKQTMNCKHLFLKRFVHVQKLGVSFWFCISFSFGLLKPPAFSILYVFCLYSFVVLILFVVLFVSCCCLFHNCAFSIFSLYFFWWLFLFHLCILRFFVLWPLFVCLLAIPLFFLLSLSFVCALSFFFAFLSDFCLLHSFTHLYLLLLALCFLSLVSFLFLFALFLFLLSLTFPLHFLLLPSDLAFLVWFLPILVCLARVCAFLVLVFWSCFSFWFKIMKVYISTFRQNNMKISVVFCPI